MKQIIISLLLVLSVGLFLCGCEESKGNEGLIISPSSRNMSDAGTPRWFAVIGKNDAADSSSDSSTSTGTNTESTVTSEMALSDLSYPLEWSVSNPALGTITESSGDSALYQKNNASGQQTITARDQYGNEGYAAVYQ